MKLIKFTIITLFLILFVFCGKDSTSIENKQDDQNESLASLINKKIIFEIEDKKYSNSDFRLFLRFKFSNSKEILSNEKLLSRLLDSFIEKSMILYRADNASTIINENDIRNYMTENNIQKKNWTYQSVSNLLKVQKYLYSTIYKDISVSDYNINLYYRNNKNKFIKKDEIELYQISLKNKEKAIKIRGELLNSPGKFDQLAENHSESVESAKKGYMGKFETGDLPKDIEKVVFSLGINRISRVIESQFGFHIFKVTKRRKRRQLYLSNVKENIKKELLNKKILFEYNKFINKLKNDLNKRIFLNNLFFKYISIKGDSNEEKNTNTLNHIPDGYVKYLSKL
ncbi:MAG: peptidylprolyl isomerase [Acidobacteriota bacterium]